MLVERILEFFKISVHPENKIRTFGPEKLSRENLTELLSCTEILCPYIASWIFSLEKVSKKLDFNLIRKINPIEAETLARNLCYYIPNQCSRYFRVTRGVTIGACSLNPLNVHLTNIRMKAQEYLEQIGSPVPTGPTSMYLPDTATSIANSFPVISKAYKIQGGIY